MNFSANLFVYCMSTSQSDLVSTSNSASNLFTPLSMLHLNCYLIHQHNKKYRYQEIKQKEQSELEIQKTRQLHELRRHKWQDNIRCSRRISISCSACGTRHDVFYVVSRNETYSWQQYQYTFISIQNMPI